MIKPTMHKFIQECSTPRHWIVAPELVAGYWENETFMICSAENPLATDVYIDVAIDRNDLSRYFINSDGWLPVLRSNDGDYFYISEDECIPISKTLYNHILVIFNEDGQPLFNWK